MFEPKLPDGFTQVKQLSRNMEHGLGLYYCLEILSIVQDPEGRSFVRRYTNTCDTGANGRPETFITDLCFMIREEAPVSGISEKNWREFIADSELHPSVVIERSNGIYVNMEIWDDLHKNPSETGVC